jgi:hypothetical protein
MADQKRSYVGGNFMFQLDGVKCGFVKSIGGGAVKAEIVKEPTGPDLITRKHILSPRFEDFEMEIGFSMSRAIYEWIEASWRMNHLRKDGAIISADRDMNIRSEREFSHALVTETGVPKCDGSGKEPAYMTVKFSPEHSRFKQGSGKISGELNSRNQKAWLPSNFRLEMAGLDCTRVSSVDAFKIVQKVVETEVNEQSGGADDKCPAKLEFPSIKVTLAEATAQTWIDWFESFVIKGNNHENEEKSGSLVFLTSNREKELLRINMFNLGIFKLAPDKSEANEDKIKRVTAELYCERMEFQYQDFVSA